MNVAVERMEMIRRSFNFTNTHLIFGIDLSVGHAPWSVGHAHRSDDACLYSCGHLNFEVEGFDMPEDFIRLMFSNCGI